MSAGKMMEFQQQVRRDNEDLQDYLRDLNNWESDIKRKDTKLRQNEEGNEDLILPPVRNHGNQVREKKQRKKKKVTTEPAVVEDTPNAKPLSEQPEEKKKRIRAYDYRSWDKFDVDEACADVDSDEDGTKSSSDYETDSDAEREMEERRRKIQEAIAEKDKGNTYFKQGNYDHAVTCYSAGMEADPENGVLPANRAMALLKLKRYSEAEADCSTAIRLDCTYVKAYARRGAARIELQKLDEAKKDFQQVLNLESSNKQAISEIKRIDRLLKQKEEKLKKSQEPSNIVHAIEKPIHLRSAKPMKRITIEEIGTGTEEEAVSPRLSSNGITIEEQKSSQTTGSAVSTTIKNDDTTTNAADRLSQKSDAESPNRTNATKKVNTEPSEPFHRTSSPPSVPAMPNSSFQLEADLKKLDKHPQLLYQYFKQISPDSFPSLFRQSLDARMLSKILTILHEHYIPNQEPVFAVLDHLSKVKRFDMNVMFMSKTEKQVVAELMEYCRSTETQSTKELNAMSKKYGL